ncbi:phosphocarrier protein HPr [Solibacillus sp. R5-41]|uniref:HPr family phosphocarrier protein n=1 Tax=Solibacillus sp. R5-41 TaxID=2048654 RepID=UPI000C125ED5|nr:HPr family phosphocarrier protein [Solibacillus sp. R5-41]ATP41501.1 phosphocarrier protein HPr [Solibacillus sp. R5-41]
MEKMFKITAPEGLHARPAALLVSAATPFKADITLHFKEKTANLKSIIGVMAQGVAPGSTIVISTQGSDEAEALQAISDVIATKGIGEEC